MDGEMAGENFTRDYRYIGLFNIGLLPISIVGINEFCLSELRKSVS